MINTIRAIKFKWPDAEWEVDDIEKSPIVFRKWIDSANPPSQAEVDAAIVEYLAYTAQEEQLKQKLAADKDAAIVKIASTAKLSKDEQDAFKEVIKISNDDKRVGVSK